MGRAPARLDLAVDGAGHLVAGQQLGGRRLLTWSSYQRSPSASESAVSAANIAGTYSNMKRLPSELRSTPPSPRTPSVTRRPRTDSGHTMPVGWNCTNSMSITSAPAHSAMAWPSPVDSHELEVYFQDFPIAAGGEHEGLRLKHDHLARLGRQ